MRSASIFLTPFISRLSLTLFCSSLTYAQPFTNDFLTWEKKGMLFRLYVKVEHEQLVFNKNKERVELIFSSSKDFQNFKSRIVGLTSQQGLFKLEGNFQEDFQADGGKILLPLTGPRVEAFSYYDTRLNAYVIDFWQEPGSPADETVKEKKLAKIPKKKIQKKKDLKKVLVKTSSAPTDSIGYDIKDYRDFRYGAAFVWNYEPILPEIKSHIDLGRKTVEHFYPIEDVGRDNEKSAHIQLAINFFRSNKFGKMSKSLELFSQKYKPSDYQDIRKYLQANALLREALKSSERGLRKSAIALLKELENSSSDSFLKTAILRYLSEHYLEAKDYPSLLTHAKKLYVISHQNHDKEVLLESIERIFYSLSRLNQIEGLEEFSSDPYVKKIFPRGLMQAYQSKVYLEKELYQEWMRKTENKAGSESWKSWNPALLYNTAEASFRMADYKKAVTFFDRFVKDFSYHPAAASARLRIGLSYDLEGRNPKMAEKIYEMTLNRSPYPMPRIEARIRYAGIALLRKRDPNASELEKDIFLENTDQDKGHFTKDLQKLLWLTRLRSFIVKKDYKKAQNYFELLEIQSFSPSDRKVFEADAAEIVFGRMSEAFARDDWARVVKLWESEGKELSHRLGYDITQLKQIGFSYVQAGLLKKVSEISSILNDMGSYNTRNYPLWVSRSEQESPKSLAQELEVTLLAKTENSAELLSKLKSLKEWDKAPYFFGLAAYKQKKYGEAIKHFEKLVTNGDALKRLAPFQTAFLVTSYVDSLYQKGDAKKASQVLKVLAQDLDDVRSPSLKKASERIHYLYVEDLGSNRPSGDGLRKESQKFLLNFPKSQYRFRVQYLLGSNYSELKKYEEAEKIFLELIEDEKTPNVVKELAKTEVAAIEFNKKIVSY